jgi:OmpA-OmpF porin, OOP family
MVRMSGVVVLLTLVAGGAASGQEKAKGDKPFDDISHKQIKELVEKAKKDGKLSIDGSDTKDNQIPQGTILCYVTSDKQYGKLKVVEYGYDLKLKWVTYAEDGSVSSKGDSLVIRGTFTCDLDKGVEGGKDSDKSKDDFWWEQNTRTTRSLVFRNGAVFVVYPNEKK